MADEIELKVAVADHKGLLDALQAAGAGPAGAWLQTDRFFDTQDRSFRREDRGLRIRRIEPLGEGGEARTVVTYKGPRRKAGELKVRPEFETPVGDPDVLARVFEACGLQNVLTIQKRRSSWRIGGCAVELDELPVIGRFVEIEGPDAEAVRAVRDRLGVAGEPITDSYAALIAARLADLPIGAEVTFETEPRWR